MQTSDFSFQTSEKVKIEVEIKSTVDRPRTTYFYLIPAFAGMTIFIYKTERCRENEALRAECPLTPTEHSRRAGARKGWGVSGRCRENQERSDAGSHASQRVCEERILEVYLAQGKPGSSNKRDAGIPGIPTAVVKRRAAKEIF